MKILWLEITTTWRVPSSGRLTATALHSSGCPRSHCVAHAGLAACLRLLDLQTHATMPIPAPPILTLKPQAPGINIRY